MLKAKAKQIDGQTVVIGGESYVIPPLNFGAIRKFSNIIAAQDISEPKTEASGFDSLARRLPLIHAAFSRNYECTLEEVEDLVDLQNFGDVLNAVMAVSKIVPKSAEEKSDIVKGESLPVQ